MCTVTWLLEKGAYELFCNRDERHERAEAEPPTVRERDGVRYLAPTDPDGGGTWIAVNERGLTLCLLNGYRASDDLVPAPAFRSRGLLVDEFAAMPDALTACARLGERDLSAYRSFDLLIMDGRGFPRLASWNRAAGRTRFVTARAPLVSCPVRTPEVRRARTNTLMELYNEHGRVDAGLLQRFHESRHPDAWIWSVSMQHDVAATRSLSRVRVSGTEASFVYTPGRPGDIEPLPPVVLGIGRD